MARGAENRVRASREARGLSQLALAESARLTRQSIGAIESGKAVPSVDVALRIASALDASVEALFGQSAHTSELHAETWSPPLPGRVALAQVAGRWVSYPLGGRGLATSADGLARAGQTNGGAVEPLRSEVDLRDKLVVMGCAAALGLIADRLNSHAGAGRFWWLPTSSTRALDALSKRHTHVAGVHLVDARSGESNLVDVRRHPVKEPLSLITLARWEAGLLVAAGNPLRIRGVSDLGRRRLRLVSREPGSGARRLLERQLRAAGLAPGLAQKAALTAAGHLEVAQLIALGAADAGVGTRDVAIACGLGFLPLAEERYDLVMPRAALEDTRVQRLLDVMTSGTTRRELDSLGYDVRATGQRVAEVDAA